jgi:hypothetical protein
MSEEPRKCPKCKGKKTVSDTDDATGIPVPYRQMTCDLCEGSGLVVECPICSEDRKRGFTVSDTKCMGNGVVPFKPEESTEKRNWREEIDENSRHVDDHPNHDKVDKDFAWELLAEVERLEPLLKEYILKVDILERENDRLRAQNEGFQITIRNMEKGIADQRRAIGDRNDEIARLRADMQVNGKDIWTSEQLRNGYRDFQKKDTEKQIEINKLRAELECWKKHYAPKVDMNGG